MDKNSAVVMFHNHRENKYVDIEIPLDITATDLVIGLNSAYELGIDITDVHNCYLKAENPIALLRGEKTLAQYGIRNGSILDYDE